MMAPPEGGGRMVDADERRMNYVSDNREATMAGATMTEPDDRRGSRALGASPRSAVSRGAVSRGAVRRAALVRLLVLALAGGATLLAYAAAISYAIGPGIGWTGGAVAASLGALLGLACGLILGARR